MKCGLFFVTLFCALSASMTFRTTTSAKSAYEQVISYMEYLLKSFPLMRGGGCFEKFIPLINSIADQAKVLSEVCTSTAAFKRNDLLRPERDELAGYVQQVKNSLTSCSSSPDNLGYFKCLKGIFDEDKQILDMIAKRSARLIKDYADKMQAIDKEEIICVEVIAQEAQHKSELTYAYLKECVANGQWPVTTVPTIDPTDSDSDVPSQRTDPLYKKNATAIGVPVGLAVVICLVLLSALFCRKRNRLIRTNSTGSCESLPLPSES